MKSKIISKIINAVGANPSFKVMNKIRNFVKEDLKKADKGDIKLALGGGSLLGLAQLLKSIEGKCKFCIAFSLKKVSSNH